MLEVKKIDSEQTYEIRHTVLRPHQSLEECKYDTDNKQGSFHVGAFLDGQLISIASFCLEDLPDFSYERHYRLRAMATLDDYRNSGAGRAVVQFAEKEIKNQDVYLLWCKGRTTVQQYYSKLGFSPHGEVFDYPPIGPHIIMYKAL